MTTALEATADALVVWTIYDHPEDFPDHFVVRGFRILKGGAEPMRVPYLAATLAEARLHVPDGLFRIGRSAEDAPAIVETWL